MNQIARVVPLAFISLLLTVGATSSEKGSIDADQPVPTVTRMPQADLAESDSPAMQDVLPQAASSAATYEIGWYSINGGGTVNASSANYKMGASVGQSVAGAASSTNYNMGIGFWYGAGSSGGCACDCHADPAPIGVCDGVQDVLDVVQTVNVAFRGAAPIVDPNVNCPFETTDVNCSASTDVIDVVRMVNVAFRGANPATEFCNPCL